MKKIRYIALATCIGLLLVVGVPFLINHFYMIQNKVYYTAWQAEAVLSYYGTVLAALVTGGSILVAIQQYRQPLIKKIKISIASSFLVMQNNNLGDSMYTISVCNTGIRPVQITNIYLQIERKNFLITELQHDLINKVVFPYRIEQENMVTLQISCNKISYEFQQLMNSNVLHLSSKVFIYVTDSTGGEYKQKTGLTVQDIANSYD